MKGNPWVVGGVVATIVVGINGILFGIMLWHQATTATLLSDRMSDLKSDIGRISSDLSAQIGKSETSINARLTRMEARVGKSQDETDSHVLTLEKLIADQLRRTVGGK